MSNTILEVEDMNAGYNGVAVVRNFNLTIREGEVVSILGPNGAGKTTVLLTLAGLLSPLAGRITLFGVSTLRVGSERAARDGLMLVPDDRSLFGSLSAEENLRVVRRRGGIGVDEIFDLFPRLAIRRKIQARLLSGGEQQMLALGRALVNRPRLLLIDEMSMGLAPEIVKSMLPVIREVAVEARAAVALVEQHVGLVLSIADHAVMLVHGDTVLTAKASTLRAKPSLLERAYLGEKIAVTSDEPSSEATA